jgi:hypothetical protein
MLLLAPASLVAQLEIPTPALAGLNMLRGDCQKAFTLLTKSFKSADRDQLITSCSTLEQIGGPIYGYDVVRVLEITPHLRRVYVVLLYQNQPIYLVLQAYKPGAGDWKIVAVVWNSDPDKIFPPTVVPPQRPGAVTPS